MILLPVEKNFNLSRGLCISASKHCRKMKFRTYLVLTLISKIIYVVTDERFCGFVALNPSVPLKCQCRLYSNINRKDVHA